MIYQVRWNTHSLERTHRLHLTEPSDKSHALCHGTKVFLDAFEGTWQPGQVTSSPDLCRNCIAIAERRAPSTRLAQGIGR